MHRVQARAPARIGLLGNPSDLYAGRGLGFAVDGLGVEVTLEEAQRTSLPNELFEAGWKLFSARLERDGEKRPFALRFESSVPFQSGLSGSSALLIAAIRAWSQWFEVALDNFAIAEIAWRAEVDVLGLRAGPLDRLVQAFGGLISMDFRKPFSEGAVERLEADLLPPLLIAWHSTPGTSSGDVHGPIYDRWCAGDPEISRIMKELGSNAREGCDALRRRDAEAFRECVNRNFDLRQSVFDIAPADRKLIQLGRRCGAAAKFPGSGGSALFVCEDDKHLAELEATCQAAEYTTLQPSVATPTPATK